MHSLLRHNILMQLLSARECGRFFPPPATVSASPAVSSCTVSRYSSNRATFGAFRSLLRKVIVFPLRRRTVAAFSVAALPFGPDIAAAGLAGGGPNHTP